MAQLLRKNGCVVYLMVLAILITVVLNLPAVSDAMILYEADFDDRDINTVGSKSAQFGTWTNNLGRDVLVLTEVWVGEGPVSDPNGHLSTSASRTLTLATDVQDVYNNPVRTYDLITSPPVYAISDPTDDTRYRWTSALYRIPDGKIVTFIGYSNNANDTAVDGRVKIIEPDNYLQDDPYVWYVDGTNGDNDNDGHSVAKALATIAQALTSAAGGDVIVILPGTYSGQVDLETNAENLTLRGTSREGVIITTADAEHTIKMYSGCHLENMTIQNTNTTNSYYAITTDDNTDVTNWSVRNCHIINADENGIRSIYCSNVLIEGCTVESSHNGMRVQNKGSGQGSDQGPILIKDCLVKVQASGNWSSAIFGINVGGSATVDNCAVSVYRSDQPSNATLHVAVGIVTNGLNSSITVNNCSVKVLQDDAGSDSPVIGIGINNNDNIVMNVRGCSIWTRNDGSGRANDLEILASSASSTIKISGSSFDSSKTATYTGNTISIEAVNIAEITKDTGAAANLKSSLDKH